MAKPTKFATPICIVLTIIAAIGLVLGWYQHNVLVILILLLPAVAYEIYRTEGDSTRWSSIMLFIVLILEIWFIWKKVSFNLANYLGKTEQYVGGFWVPLGDIKVLAPIIIALVSAVLFFRTRGIYTKWLAVVIFISALLIVYIIDPEIIRKVLPSVIEQGANRYY
jgi:hypothetical protein